MSTTRSYGEHKNRELHSATPFFQLLVSRRKCATGKGMGFEHRVLELDGHRVHEIADRESEYRIQVNNLGAELVSVARHATEDGWAGYLYRDSEVKPAPKGWQSHATVMGYFLHRIKNDKTFYEAD